MKVKLTGIIEVQVEVETEIDDYFFEWYDKSTGKYYGGTFEGREFHSLHRDDKELWATLYLHHHSDEEAEIWATVTMTDIGNGEALSAEFIEAEVLDV